MNSIMAKILRQGFPSLDSRAKVALLAFLTVCAVLGYIFLVHRPMTAKAHQLEVQLAVEKMKLTKVKAEASRTAEIEDAMQNVRKELDALKRFVPSRLDYQAVLAYLDEIATVSGVRVNFIGFGDARAVKEYQAFPVEISVTGTYHGVFYFLKLLNGYPLLSCVERAEIRLKTEETRRSHSSTSSPPSSAAGETTATAGKAGQEGSKDFEGKFLLVLYSRPEWTSKR